MHIEDASLEELESEVARRKSPDLLCRVGLPSEDGVLVVYAINTLGAKWGDSVAVRPRVDVDLLREGVVLEMGISRSRWPKLKREVVEVTYSLGTVIC